MNRALAQRYHLGLRDWGDPSGDFPADPSQMISRGTRLSWSGVVAGDATSTEGLLYLGFSPGRQATLKQRLQGAGFIAEVVDYEFESLGWAAGYYRILLTVVTPIAYARAEDAFSVLKGIVWDVYGNEPQDITQSVVNVPVVDSRTGRPVYSAAPAVGSPADAASQAQAKATECNWDTQTIGEYLACQLGFNSMSSATIVVIGALVLIGIVALKK
jgi:hypothetical protein